MSQLLTLYKYHIFSLKHFEIFNFFYKLFLFFL